MALMKCPEGGRDVSSSAASCPTCGYPIQEYIKKQEYDLEVKHLTKKIVHVQFVCPEPRAKVCIKCGRAYNEYDRQNCDCGYPFAEIDYPAKQAAERTLSTALYIYEKCVVPMNIGDQESPEYISVKERLYSCINFNKTQYGVIISPEPPKEEHFGIDPKAPQTQSFIPTISPKKEIPTCPVCGSTSLTKITTTKKAVKGAIFGAFWALDDAGKTWKCNHCGSKF